MERFSLMIAAFLSLGLTAISGYIIIPWLHHLKCGQTIKEIGPTWHEKKNGTPNMGGLMFYCGDLFGVVFGYAALVISLPELVESIFGKETALLCVAVLTALCFGLVGFADDFIKDVKKRNLGLRARYKIIMQICITTVFLLTLHSMGALSTIVTMPFFGMVDFGILYYPISYVLIIGIVNAVNLTDGVDGLASSVTFVVMLGFLFVAALLGHTTLAIFAAAITGGCAGFLAWNFYPAKVFMGDTGSMFLGGAVMAAAYCMGRPELLLFFGFVYICEALSVMIQVTYFKLTHGKRIFKMSPIHHHFEMCGWSEIKIVYWFSAAAVVMVCLGCLHVYVS